MIEELLKKIFDNKAKELKEDKKIPPFREGKNFLKDLKWNIDYVLEKLNEWSKEKIQTTINSEQNDVEIVIDPELKKIVKKSIKEDLNNKIREYNKFIWDFIRFYENLKKIKFLFDEKTYLFDYDLNIDNQISWEFMKKIFEFIWVEDCKKTLEVLIEVQKEEDILLFLVMDFEKIPSDFIKKIVKEKFDIQDSNEKLIEKFINSKIIKEIWEIKEKVKRKKILEIVFLENRRFMWSDEIQQENLFNFLKNNNEKLDRILEFFRENNTKNFEQEKLIEMFENDIYEIEVQEEISFTSEKIPSIVTPEKKSEQPKTPEKKPKQPKIKTRWIPKLPEQKTKKSEKLEKIELKNPIDKKIETILKENNEEEIEKIAKEIEKFLDKIEDFLHPLNFSSTNDNKGKWWGHYIAALNLFFKSLKKNSSESNRDFLERISILDLQNFYENVDNIKNDKLKKIKDTFEIYWRKWWLIDILTNFWNEIIWNIKTNQKENLVEVIKKYNEILEKEIKVLERKIFI